MTIMASFSLYVSYAQVAVFDSALEKPFNDWTERHIQQGFSWRPGSVSFATIEEAATHLVTIDVADDASVSEAAIRVIETPFHVPQNGSIEIASISESFVTDVPFGLYALRFSYFLATALSEPRITFQFIKTNQPSFAILRADPGLSARTGDLLLSASPA
jgi:Competence protein J (ComJ)